MVTLYMGYRPTEERIRREINAIINKGKIKKLELDLDRSTITYEYVES